MCRGEKNGLSMNLKFYARISGVEMIAPRERLSKLC